ncbi:Reverse transcriptase domain [Cinara cedri]|uniref:Reverse transcriptase domain n=1 Tax=Cinara cedri TaxID=506608 RepID=A0A5E4NPV8_9HEMI|nr:Reverse transcriptase domain [Cinara cedri]
MDRNKVTYLAFMDLEKVFDKVNWDKMLFTLREIVKEKLTRLNIGIKIDGEIVSMIRFADDTLVIADSEGDIQRVVEEMDEMLRTSEMKINSAKTKILVCARDLNVKADVYIGSQKLEQVREQYHISW